MLKVQVISREMIKPSSPIAGHLATYKLTLLDQSVRSQYIPLVFFYSMEDDDGDSLTRADKAQQLKKSLSETLTQFYPLAGRMEEGNSRVQCSDEGAEFSEARVACRLSEFLKRPYVEVLDRMVPCNLENAKSGNHVLVAAQLNWFHCGGMALGVCIHHSIADVASLATFVNGWASRSRGSCEATAPDFLLPSRHFPTEGPVPLYPFNKKDNIVMKRFVFDASKIETLRSTGVSSIDAAVPTRIEAISALIWRCIMRRVGDEGSRLPSFAGHAVDIRRRMSPALPGNSFGNLVVPGVTEAAFQEDTQRCLEQKVRNAIRGVDNNVINELRKTDGLYKAFESKASDYEKCIGSGMEVISFTSWCGFPLYAADFRWGKPVWVSTCTASIKNYVVFTSTSGGDGIEAWVNMEDVDMARFELDQELLRFVSPPSAD